MHKLAWRKLRLLIVGAFAVGVVPAVWAGNTCRDTIRTTCQSLGWVTIRCCQILSNRYNYGPCYCEQFRDSNGYTYYFRGGITDVGPSCEPQNDTCC
jgi:hypothetical protein